MLERAWPATLADMKLAPSTILARLMFYLGLLALVAAALTLSFPDWQRYGITGASLLKLTDTFMIISIAMMVAGLADKKAE